MTGSLTQSFEPTRPAASSANVLTPSAWVDRHSDYLFRYAFSRLRDSTAAEEVVQETFLAGVRYADQFAGRGNEQAWLLGILKRKIIDFVRTRTKHAASSPYEDETELTAQLFDAAGNWKAGALGRAPAPGQEIEMSELWGIVEECLKKLPEGLSGVFVLSVVEEMESADICKQLGISSANFWVRMHRARLGLATCVGKKWGTE